ncbi:hypothetical protein ACFCQI_01615 [Rhodanobacter sp. FW102-FHT14D06]|uniref:Peptidase n=2 Tax=unclassified Rhodanobacter TaxID=2621553 RepID=A0AB74UWW1_9GAMM
MSEQATAAATPTDTAAVVDATTQAAAATTATSETTTATTADATTTAAATEQGKDDAGKTDTTEAAQGAPEKYELAAPDGFELEPETTTAFEGVARELNLTNDQANKLIPLGAQLAQKIQAKQTEAHQQQVAQWAEDTKADKEIGGDKFDASLAVALKARDRFATAELKTLMDQTGLGNHPEIVRLFHRIGTAISDDTFVQAPSAGGSQKSAASVLFDHPSSQIQR